MHEKLIKEKYEENNDSYSVSQHKDGQHGEDEGPDH
jgi:hypothetical protein